MINKNTPVGKGIRTALQAIGAVVIGYFVTIWNVPGVPEATTEYAKTEGVGLIVTLSVLVGIPAGIIAFVQNRLGR